MSLGTRFFAATYDRFMRSTEDAGLRAFRGELLAGAAGDVLEIGGGTGLNLRHYGAGVQTLTVTEPYPPMLRRLQRRALVEAPAATVLGAPAEELPFDDASFDVVMASEVLEHIPADAAAFAEIARVVRPGGRVAVTVPRFWPERVCWALSRDYHDVPGGHVRIYTGDVVSTRMLDAGLTPTGAHHAHALHSPYWWLNCALGKESIPSRLYHQVLVWDIMKRPWLTRTAEAALNPVLGKSLVVYATKPAMAERPRAAA
jgi:SAM-dependent methyltransferase